jgi:hypothetical protein
MKNMLSLNPIGENEFIEFPWRKTRNQLFVNKVEIV